jgi:hypothetical protein
MPKLKTNGNGLNQILGLNPSNSEYSPLPLLTFPQLWIIIKEKRSKKENNYNIINN